jgi:hypothetical protein
LAAVDRSAVTGEVAEQERPGDLLTAGSDTAPAPDLAESAAPQLSRELAESPEAMKTEQPAALVEPLVPASPPAGKERTPFAWRRILRRTEPVSPGPQEAALTEPTTCLPAASLEVPVAAAVPTAEVETEVSTEHEAVAVLQPEEPPPMALVVESASQITATGQEDSTKEPAVLETEASEPATPEVLEPEPSFQSAGVQETVSALPRMETIPALAEDSVPSPVAVAGRSDEPIHVTAPPILQEISVSDRVAPADAATIALESKPAADLAGGSTALSPEAVEEISIRQQSESAEVAKSAQAAGMVQAVETAPPPARKERTPFAWRRILRRAEPVSPVPVDSVPAEVSAGPSDADLEASVSTEIPASTGADAVRSTTQELADVPQAEAEPPTALQVESVDRVTVPSQPDFAEASAVLEPMAGDSAASSFLEVESAIVPTGGLEAEPATPVMEIPVLSAEAPPRYPVAVDRSVEVPLASTTSVPAGDSAEAPSPPALLVGSGVAVGDEGSIRQGLASPVAAEAEPATLLDQPVTPTPPTGKEASSFVWRRILRHTEPVSTGLPVVAPSEPSALASDADLSAPASADAPTSIEATGEPLAPLEAALTPEPEPASQMALAAEPSRETVVAMQPAPEVSRSAKAATVESEAIVVPDISDQQERPRLAAEVAGSMLVTSLEAAGATGIFSELEDSEIDAILAPLATQHEVMPPAAPDSRMERSLTEISGPASLLEAKPVEPVPEPPVQLPTPEAPEAALAPEVSKPYIATEPSHNLSQERATVTAISETTSDTETGAGQELTPTGEERLEAKAQEAEVPVAASSAMTVADSPSLATAPEEVGVRCIDFEIPTSIDVSVAGALPVREADAISLTPPLASPDGFLPVTTSELGETGSPVESAVVHVAGRETASLEHVEPTALQETPESESAPPFWKRIFRRAEPVSLDLAVPTPPQVFRAKVTEPKVLDVAPGTSIPSVEPVSPIQALSDAVSAAAIELAQVSIATGEGEHSLARIDTQTETKAPTAAMRAAEDTSRVVLAEERLHYAENVSLGEVPPASAPAATDSRPAFVPMAELEAAPGHTLPPTAEREPMRVPESPRRPKENRDYPHFVPLKPESGRPPVAFVAPKLQRASLTHTEPEVMRTRSSVDAPENERPHFVPFHTREEPPATQRADAPASNEHRLADDFGPPRFRVRRQGTQEMPADASTPLPPTQAAHQAGAEHAPAEQDDMALEIVDRVFQSLRPALMDEVKRLLREKGSK